MARSSISVTQLRGTKLPDDAGQHTRPIEGLEIGPRSHQHLATNAPTTRWVMLPSQKQNSFIALGSTPLKVLLLKTDVSQPLLDLIKWIPFPIPRFSISIIAVAPGCFQGWNQTGSKKKLNSEERSKSSLWTCCPYSWGHSSDGENSQSRQ